MGRKSREKWVRRIQRLNDGLLIDKDKNPRWPFFRRNTHGLVVDQSHYRRSVSEIGE